MMTVGISTLAVYHVDDILCAGIGLGDWSIILLTGYGKYAIWNGIG